MEEKNILPVDQAEEQGEDINFREYILIILKRRWMILIVLAVIVAATAVYSFRQTPVYRSAAVLYMDMPNNTFVPDPSQMYYWIGYESFFNTQYKLLKSKTLAVQVANKLCDANPSLRICKDIQKGDMNNLAAGLLGMMEIAPVKDTNLTELIAVTPAPELSMILANTWAEEYRDYSLSSQYEYTQKTENLLADQVNALQGEIAEKEKLLQDFSLEKQVVKLEKGGSMSTALLADLNNAIAGATKARIDAQGRYQDLQSRNKESIQEVLTSSLILALRHQYAQLDLQIQQKSETFKSHYPEMIRLRTEKDQVKRKLDAETTDIYRKAIHEAWVDYQGTVNKEKALQAQMDTSKRDSVATYRKEFDYDRLLLEVNNKKQLLESLLQKRNETGVSAQVQQKKVTTLRIVDRAELPAGVFKPDIRSNILYGVLFGFIGAVGLAFILEYMDRSLKSADDIRQHTKLPFLGVVPRYVLSDEEPSNGNGHHALVLDGSASQDNNERVDLFTLHNPASIASESIRILRTSLLMSFPEAPPKSILVTSSRPGEGKTFIACNLAVALAQMDKRVVLVDADMRNPRVHHVWKMGKEMGLSHYLTTNAKAVDVLVASNLKDLSLITSGDRTPRPAELLSSTRFNNLMTLLEEQFDHVIVDSPPIMPVADSVILSTRCSCVVMVVRGGVTPREVVLMAKNRLLGSNAVIAGAVLNCVDMKDPYYSYSYYANYSYRYGSEHESHPKALPGV